MCWTTPHTHVMWRCCSGPLDAEGSVGEPAASRALTRHYVIGYADPGPVQPPGRSGAYQRNGRKMGEKRRTA